MERATLVHTVVPPLVKVTVPVRHGAFAVGCFRIDERRVRHSWRTTDLGGDGCTLVRLKPRPGHRGFGRDEPCVALSPEYVAVTVP